MFSNLRNSATNVLEKAKLAIGLDESEQEDELVVIGSKNAADGILGCSDVEGQKQPRRQQQENQNPIIPPVVGGVSDPAGTLRLSLKELRNGSTRALDKAKSVLTGSTNSSSSTVATVANDDDNNNSNNDINKSLTDKQKQSEQTNVDRLEELSQYCPKLTIQQRLIGFLMSFSLGYLIAFFSFRFFIELMEGNPLPFALNYTFGHILQLLASIFLCGPKRQFKNMFDEKRRQTSIVYLSCLVLSLSIVFIPMPSKIKLLVLIIVMMVQFCASCWYSLSYIPYGRRTALRIIKSILGIEDSSNDSNSSNGYFGIQLPGLGGGVLA